MAETQTSTLNDWRLDVCFQVTLEMVHSDITPVEEHNTTEAAKTYKVNCDKRNMTGLQTFTVQVLNASQVSMMMMTMFGGPFINGLRTVVWHFNSSTCLFI